MRRVSTFSVIGFLILVGIIIWYTDKAKFPKTEYIRGFARVKGVPNTSSYVFTGHIQDVLQECRNNPRCVGVSETDIFVTNAVFEKGKTVETRRDHRGSISYVKDAYPTIFL